MSQGWKKVNERERRKVKEMEKWTKMDDIDTRSARLAEFFQKAQSHSCK